MTHFTNILKKKNYFFGILVLALIWNISVFAQNCDDQAEPVITVTPVATQPTFDDTLSASDLKRLAASYPIELMTESQKHSLISDSARIGGYTDFKSIEVNEKWTMKMTELPDKTFCARLINLDASITLGSPSVYVANEVPPNSCTHDEILTHELKHVAVAMTFLEKSAPITKSYLEQWTQQMGSIHGANEADAQSTLSASIKEYLEGFSQQMGTVFRAEEAGVDTPEEYRRLEQSCNGQTRDIFRHTRP